MAQLTYRDAVARGIAQEMERDDGRAHRRGRAGAGGVFKTTAGLLERFGPGRVIDTPIAEQAILGAAMGAAMTGLRPIAEIMFSDFFAVCWDLVVNQMAKTRYMTNGQVTLPLVVKSGNGGGCDSARSTRSPSRTGRWRCPASRSSRRRHPKTSSV